MGKELRIVCLDDAGRPLFGLSLSRRGLSAVTLARALLLASLAAGPLYEVAELKSLNWISKCDHSGCDIKPAASTSAQEREQMLITSSSNG